MTTTDDQVSGNGEGRVTPEEVRGVQFTRAGVLHPGYEHTEVDAFLSRVGEELDRLVVENAVLHDQVADLEGRVRENAPQEPPSEQAVRILAVAQQTADDYVAEAEDFSRQMTTDARAQYEERLREARDNAGAIIQAAQEAAARMVAEGGLPAGDGQGQLSTEELQEQVDYLKAFGQAVRTQLRAYLEALISDVESEWGRAHPTALPEPPRSRMQRSDGDDVGGQQPLNVVADTQ